MHKKEILKRMNSHKIAGHPVSPGKFATVRNAGQGIGQAVKKSGSSVNVGENSAKVKSSPLGIGGGY